MTAQLKAEIKEVMLTHLRRLGYPEISNRRIMKQVPILYDVLDHKFGLKHRITLKQFYKIAATKFFEAEEEGRF